MLADEREKLYQGIDVGPFPIPALTSMIAGIRLFPKVEDSRNIELLSNQLIDGGSDTVALAERLLRELFRGEITIDQARDEAVSAWVDSNAGGHTENVSDGLISMIPNARVFETEAQAWLQENANKESQ